jgi:peptide/nickel transport system permease protein
MIAQIREQLGLDQPFLVQAARWYAGLLQGDLGRSILLGQSVFWATLDRVPVTLALSLYALAITLLLGLGSGIVAALRQNSWADQAAMMFAMLGISVPNFFLGLLFIIWFAVGLGWLPSGGYVAFTDDPWGWFRTSTMPAVSLALLQVGLLARVTRSTMLEVLRQDYVRTARAKGLPRQRVLRRHVLRNSLIPIVSLFGLDFAAVLGGGAILTETVFDLKGVGWYAAQSVGGLDLPPIMGVTLYGAFFIVLFSVVVDLVYAYLDPRIRPT